MDYKLNRFCDFTREVSSSVPGAPEVCPLTQHLIPVEEVLQVDRHSLDVEVHCHVSDV